MTGRPFLEEVMELVKQFLIKCEHEDIAQQLQERYELPEWAKESNPLLKKGLSKVVKEFIQHNPKAQKYYKNRVQPEETESRSHPAQINSPRMRLRSDDFEEKVSSKKSEGRPEWMAKFDQPKRLEDIDIEAPKAKEISVEVHTANKKNKKAAKKAPVVESSDYESEEDSFELEPSPEPRKKTKKDVKEEKKKEKEQPKKDSKEKNKAQQQPKPIPRPVFDQPNGDVPKRNGPTRFFSRINADELGELKNELRDNSFGAKAKFGQQGDKWGEFGYNKLKDTRGDDFKKTKGKLKNRAFQGAMMDMNKINSIPIA